MSKKSFKDNPALQFMSRAEKEIGREAPEEVRAEVREVREVADNFHMVTPVIFEAKSKRFNMLIRPSVFASLKKMAENKGTSVNDLINAAVENYIKINSK
jgi:hypothetical protein